MAHSVFALDCKIHYDKFDFRGKDQNWKAGVSYTMKKRQKDEAALVRNVFNCIKMLIADILHFVLEVYR